MSLYASYEDMPEGEADEAYCALCGERDLREVLEPVYVATREWHRVEKLCHQECRDMFVADHLPAVLASLRLVSL